MRAVQPAGVRGSLKWIQHAVAGRWAGLERPILAALPGTTAIEWRSPLVEDEFAEYRDAAFLDRVGLQRLAPALRGFWPDRGPQWDALAVSDRGHVLLVEAKAHVAEFCTPATQAGAASRARIGATLVRVAEALGSSRGALWPDLFYQYANRLAHLWLLRDAGVDARLVLVGFVGDDEMGGPRGAEAWRAAYRVADYALDLGRSHPLSAYLIHVHPEVPR